MGYERNMVTKTMLRDHGIDVIGSPGNELGRGEALCMTCPVQHGGIRDATTTRDRPCDTQAHC